MGEPRFPPPGGHTGYRDAGAPVSDRPRPPELTEPPLPRGKPVVAKRPDDPDVALAKAFYPGKPRVARASSAGAVFLALIVVLWFALQILSSRPRAHPRSPPPAAATT